MAMLQALLALAFRSAGRILNMAFGWATVMIFGKVPQDRQIYLSVIAFGSMGWIVAVLGIVFPSFATFLLAFVPLPAWVDRTWVRLRCWPWSTICARWSSRTRSGRCSSARS